MSLSFSRRPGDRRSGGAGEGDKGCETCYLEVEDHRQGPDGGQAFNERDREF